MQDFWQCSVWCRVGDSSRLALLLAYPTTRTPDWKDASIRLIAARPGTMSGDRTRETLAEMLAEVRIDAEPLVVDRIDPPAVLAQSGDASLFFMPFALRRGRIRPALAMWVFFSIAVGGSLGTYLSGGEFSVWDNILNAADLLLCTYVAGLIAIFGDASTRFTPFDRGCPGAVVLIIAFWAFSRQHVAANLLIQLILVIAYFPVVKRLWHATENAESFVAWTGLLLATVISLLSSKGSLATVYALRAIISTALLMVLMARAQRRGALASTAPVRQGLEPLEVPPPPPN